MAEPTSVISVIASIVSAIGGAVACVAAFRSAGHAKNSFDEGQKAEKILTLRQLSLTAHQVKIEVDRIKWIAQILKSTYKNLAVFSGASGGSRVTLLTNEVDEKIKIAESLEMKANPFIELQTSLLNGPLEEISVREVKISQYLIEAIALREKIEMELSEIQAQNAVYQEISIRSLKDPST